MMEDGFEFPKYVTITKGKTKYHKSIKIKNSSSPRQDVLNNQFKKSPNITNNSNMPKGGGLTKPMKLSEELADICGVEEASRGQCMKHLFAYIKEHGLKDPENGSFFTPDKKMAQVFGTEKIRSFSMSKYIGAHLSKIEWMYVTSA